MGSETVVAPVQTHMYASLASGDCTFEELEEFVLFFATQCGWPRAQLMDQYLEEAAARLGVERTEFHRWAKPDVADARVQRGRAAYQEIMCVQPPSSSSPFVELGYLGYLFGEIWTRPVLSRRERRLIALCCHAISGKQAEQHAYAALKSGDLAIEELQELSLHFAVYCGWQAGMELDQIIDSARIRFEAEVD